MRTVNGNMSSVVAVLVLNFCIFFICTFAVEEAQNSKTDYNPLIMIERKIGGYKVPQTVKIENDRRVFKSSKKDKYFCPDINSDLNDRLNNVDDKDKAPYFDYCLFDQMFGLDDPKVCKTEPKPIMMKVPWFGNKPYKCGPEKKGILYKVAYAICKPKYFTFFRNQKKIENILRVEEVTMYNFCFNHDTKKVIFTKHHMSPSGILRNLEYLTNLTHYECDKLSTLGFEGYENDFKIMANEIEKYGLMPHMAVPVEDMGFGIWKKSLYHYRNVMGMAEEIHLLWNFIEQRIRQKAISMDLELQIRMGEFVSYNSEKFWLKIVYDKVWNSGVVIIVRDSGQTKFPLTVLNCMYRCNLVAWEGYVEGMRTDLAYCCEIDFDHTALFGITNLNEWTIAYMNLDELGSMTRGRVPSMLTELPSQV